MKTADISLGTLDNRDIFKLIRASRKGVDHKTLYDMIKSFPFNLSEWAKLLHISERTIQRYRHEKKKLDSIHSDRFLNIMILLNKGIEVFGNSENFMIWLESVNIALGKIKPIDIIDNAFGIKIIIDELTKIEHGVLA